jgi:predicted permease
LRATGVFVTPGYFELLGLPAAEGRLFAMSGAAPELSEVVLSHGCWRRVFGADPGAVGRDVLVNGEKLRVVGVAPRGFHGTELEQRADVFLPLLSFRRLSPYKAYFDERAVGIFHGLGRLAPGVDVGQAAAELDALGRQIAAEHAAELDGTSAGALPLVEGVLGAASRGRYRGTAPVLRGAALILLAVACLNVSGLLVVRGAGRSRELALRRALGGHLARLLAVENLLLFLVGGLLSLPAAKLFLHLLWLFRPPQFPADALRFGIDGPGAAVCVGTALVASLVFGLLPAWRAARTNLAADLRASAGIGRLAPHVHRAAVVLQVAFTLVALVGAGLFWRTLRASAAIDLGFDADRLLVASVSPGEQGYDEARTRDIYRRLRERVEALPGVDAAAWSERRLLRGARIRRQVYLDGRPDAVGIDGRTTHRVNVVGRGFFATAGIPLRGRDFSEREGDAPVAVVNATMAERLWPGEDAVGRTFRFDFPDRPAVRVVGVAADVRYRQVRETEQFFVYLPLAQNPASAMVLHVRHADAAGLAGAVRDTVREIDPALPLADLAPLRRFIDEALWLERVSATLLAVYGVLALILATVGVYSLLAATVSRRQREVGVRLALGARRGDVLRGVLGEALRLTGVGLGLGGALALLLVGPVVGSQLYGVSPGSPAAYGFGAAVLLAAALAGAFGPAWRASRSDPAETLRSE